MDTSLVGRALHFDYLMLVPLVAVAFNAWLLAVRRWRELAVFNIAGLLNVGAELVMISAGMRHFDTDSFVLRTVAVLCLAWVTNGFLFSLAYINVRYLLGREQSRRLVVTADLVFVVGLTLAVVPYGFFDGTVHTWREMSHTTSYLEPIIAIVLAAGIVALGHRRLLVQLLIVGCVIDLVFEARLFLFGIRPASQLDWLTVSSRILFEMNIVLMVGFLLLKTIFGLSAYRDNALTRESGMGFIRRLRTSLMGGRLLRRKLGLVGLFRLLRQVKKRERRGEPWSDLEPPATDNEQRCRREAGQVILIYDLLTEQIGQKEALELLTTIVSEAGILQLREAVPKLERKRLEAMEPDEQERFLRNIMDQFPNATVGDLELTPSTFRYTISHCQFAELTRRVGRPQLGPLFCSGDGLYFERDLPEVHFDRPQTLAEGGSCCDFRFRWK